MRSRLIGAALAAAALFCAPLAWADNYVVKDGNGSVQTMGSKAVGSVQYPEHVTVDSTGADATDTTNHAVRVNVVAGSASNSAASATGSAVPANAGYSGLNFSGNLKGWVGDTNGYGDVNVMNIPHVVVDTAPSTAVTNAGTFVTQDAASVAQNSTTSGQSGALAQCAVTTSSPTYTTAKTDPVSCDTSGSLRVNVVSGSTGNAAAGNTGSAVPTQGGYTGLNNGGNLIGMIGDSSGRGIVAGAGTAGTPAGGVLTIQGVTSMTKLLVTPDSVALPANQSVNTAQVNGVTTLTGTGAVGTGAQRVAVGTDTATIAGSAPGTAGSASANVVTVQGVASMTKLLVTPDSVALPANQSVNVSQINGVTTLMGNGVTGTGSQRVTIASDNTAFSVNSTDAATSATGSAAPSKAAFMGANSSGNLTGIIQADSSAAISVSTATTTQLIALSSGKKIYVSGWDLVVAAADNVTLEYGTGTACATGTTTLTGAYNFGANGGIQRGNGLGVLFVVPASNALCMVTSAATQASGSVSYTQF